MKKAHFHLACLVISVVIFAHLVNCAPAVEKPETTTSTLSKSAFGPVFDEIVVESSLTVRRKNPSEGGDRQGRQNFNKTTTIARPERILVKRQIRPFGSSAANSQAQAFNSIGPLGSFGASATGAQTQSLAGGPGGIFGSGAFSGTQQYRINGQTVDIAFGNAFSGANGSKGNAGGAAITVTGPDGIKRPFKG